MKKNTPTNTPTIVGVVAFCIYIVALVAVFTTPYLNSLNILNAKNTTIFVSIGLVILIISLLGVFIAISVDKKN